MRSYIDYLLDTTSKVVLYTLRRNNKKLEARHSFGVESLFVNTPNENGCHQEEAEERCGIT